MIRKVTSGIGSLLRHPIGVIVTTNAVLFAALWLAKVPTNLYVTGGMLVVDALVAYFLLDRLIFFFAQFVLPIQNEKYRQEIYSRVRNFETGYRGPAMFVKNGRVIMHKGEQDKRGAGVIILDTASALVLRTDTQITDTAGPGVKFTRGDEYIAGSVDLRTQWQYIGPLPGDANPAADNNAQMRYRQTQGLTRDGFEVAASISIRFSIKRPRQKVMTEGGVISQYGYDEDAVRNAITREMVELSTTDKTRMEWKRLPAHLVVNAWREYVRKFKLGDLFNGDTSGLQLIEKMINKRMKQPSVEGLDDTGARTGEWVNSIEHHQLTSRGLEIQEIRIHNIIFDPDMEKKYIEQWSTEWLKHAQREEKLLKEKENILETISLEEASKIFARIASRQFSAKTTEPQENVFKTLQLLILPLKEHLLAVNSPNSDTEKELRKLEEVWKWLLDNNTAGPAPSDGNLQEAAQK